jgi:hypothetical protein
LTGAYQDYLVVHEGDVVSATYDGGPIEILFLDICKSWEINAAVVGTFFTHLLPGRSLVVQQDYAHFYAYWLVVTMDFFADYFKSAGHVADDGTAAVFRCVRRIPGPLLRTDLRRLPLSRKRDAFERALPRFQGWQHAQLLIGYCRMLLDQGEWGAAEEVARRIDPALYRHPLNWEGMRFIVGRFDFLKDQAA